MDAACQTDPVLLPKPSAELPEDKDLEEGWKFLCDTSLSETSLRSQSESYEDLTEMADQSEPKTTE